jgi:hypothetical protein
MLNFFIYTASQCNFGRPKCFVNDFVCAACDFGFDVFDYNFAAGLGVGSILPIGDNFFFNPELNGVSSVIFCGTMSVFFCSAGVF